MQNKTKLISIVALMTICLSGFSQSKKDIIGYWQNMDESFTYRVFTKNDAVIYSIYPNRLGSLYYNYGFNDNEKLRSLTDLKDFGMFYFEVDPSDFSEEYKDKDGTYHGIQANIIQMDADKNRFQIYDSARPGQRGTYKRIKQLPQKLADILQSKGIIINIPKQDVKITLSIKSIKARIYTEPDKPSKMFLLKGDIFTILQEKDNWLYIFYVTSTNKEIKGWIKKEDTFTK